MPAAVVVRPYRIGGEELRHRVVEELVRLRRFAQRGDGVLRQLVPGAIGVAAVRLIQVAGALLHLAADPGIHGAAQQHSAHARALRFTQRIPGPIIDARQAVQHGFRGFAVQREVGGTVRVPRREFERAPSRRLFELLLVREQPDESQHLPFLQGLQRLQAVRPPVRSRGCVVRVRSHGGFRRGRGAEQLPGSGDECVVGRLAFALSPFAQTFDVGRAHEQAWVRAPDSPPQLFHGGLGKLSRVGLHKETPRATPGGKLPILGFDAITPPVASRRERCAMSVYAPGDVPHRRPAI